MIRRIILNGFATYSRLATTFAFGLVYTSYVTSKLGLEGFGLVSLAAGTFGISFAIEAGIGLAVSRELAPAFATKCREQIRRAFCITFSASCIFGILGWAVSLLLAFLSTKGVIKIPEDQPFFLRGLVWLLLSEGSIALVRSIFAVWHRSAFANQMIWLDSIYLIIERLGKPLVAIYILQSADSAEAGMQLIPQLAIGNFVWASLAILVASLVSVLVIPESRVVPAMANKGELWNILGRIFDSLQFSFLSGFTPQFLALVVNSTLGLAFNGIWSVVLQLGGWCTLLGEGLLRGVDPIMVHFRANQGESQLRSTLIVLCRVQAYVFIVLGACILSAGPRLIDAWVGKSWASDPALDVLGLTPEQAIHFACFIAFLQLIALVPRMVFSPLERTLFGFGHMRSYLGHTWVSSVGALVISLPAMHFTGWLGWAPVSVLGANLYTYAIGVHRASTALDTEGSRLDASKLVLRPLAVLLVSWPIAPVLWSFGSDWSPTTYLVSVGLHVLATGLVVILMEWGQLKRSFAPRLNRRLSAFLLKK